MHRGGWGFTDSPKIIENTLTKNGAFLSYKFNKSKVLHKRYLYSKNNTLIVADVAECEGDHILSTIWNVSESVEYEKENEKIKIFIGEDVFSLTTFPNSHCDIKKNTISPHYNEEIDYGYQIVFSTKFTNQGISLMVLSTSDVQNLKENQNHIMFTIEDENIKVNKKTGKIDININNY